jgi:hypothetical protein
VATPVRPPPLPPYGGQASFRDPEKEHLKKKIGRERNGPPENGLEERLQLCQSIVQTSMRSNSPTPDPAHCFPIYSYRGTTPGEPDDERAGHAHSGNGGGGNSKKGGGGSGHHKQRSGIGTVTYVAACSTLYFEQASPNSRTSRTPPALRVRQPRKGFFIALRLGDTYGGLQHRIITEDSRRDYCCSLFVVARPPRRELEASCEQAAGSRGTPRLPP